jgi:hypothetical protein
MYPSISDNTYEPAPSPSPRFSITHARRCIGPRNTTSPMATPTRLMYLSVFDPVDPEIPVCLPQPCRARNVHATCFLAPLTWGFLRISVGRVPCTPACVSNDSRSKGSDIPSLCYSLTHSHRSIDWRNIPQLLQPHIHFSSCSPLHSSQSARKEFVAPILKNFFKESFFCFSQCSSPLLLSSHSSLVLTFTVTWCLLQFEQGSAEAMLIGNRLLGFS